VGVVTFLGDEVGTSNFVDIAGKASIFLGKVGKVEAGSCG
jgi:hypothetical protein